MAIELAKKSSAVSRLFLLKRCITFVGVGMIMSFANACKPLEAIFKTSYFELP